MRFRNKNTVFQFLWHSGSECGWSLNLSILDGNLSFIRPNDIFGEFIIPSFFNIIFSFAFLFEMMSGDWKL